jgi:SAM-dependent methyltransferase
MSTVASSTSIEAQSPPRTRCDLCGKDDAWRTQIAAVLDYLTDERFDIDRCGGCGLMVTRPMPSEAEIERFYPPRYRGNRHGFTGNMRLAARARAIESCFPRDFRGRLLDVGCGDGSFVLEMRRRGWDVCATEIDGATVERLRGQGVDAKSPAAADAEGFDRPFDAVTSWHVMEHVEQPLRVARWVKTQLKPDGVFQASVPNAGSIQARLFGRQWLHLDVPRHRYHFTPATFRALMQNAGLTVDRQTVFAWEYDWFGIIQSALNWVSPRPNGLFEWLTHRSNVAEVGAGAKLADGVVTCLLAPPIAGISFVPMLLAWACGDGATLTLTCRQAR